MENTSNSKTGLIIVVLVVGALVGGLIGYSVGNMNNDSDTSMSKDSAMMSENADGVTVGGARMVRTSDIVDNAANADNVSTTVSLVKLAGLVDTLKGEGPFTVFGPNNDAFMKLDPATVEALQKPENVDMLKKILTYHVVAGTYTSADLKVMAQNGETLKTVEGEMLTPVINGQMVQIKDAKGNTVDIETADIISSNGVTHVVKSVLMPAM